MNAYKNLIYGESRNDTLCAQKYEQKKTMKVNTEYGVMEIRVQDITPDIAKEMLELNTENRNMRRSRVVSYAQDMKQGNWKANGDPIIIGSDRILKNGQHRLKAVVESGITLKNMIVIIVPSEQANGYDMGASRSVGDVARLEGKKDICFRSNSIIAGITLSMTFAGYFDSDVKSKMRILEEIEKHYEACKWTYDNLYGGTGANQLKRAGVMGTVINAYLSGYPIKRLKEFVDVLRTGITSSEEDIVAIKLRDWLISQTRTRGGNMDQKETYYRTQNALHHYYHHRIISTCKTSNTEYYKYPREC